MASEARTQGSLIGTRLGGYQVDALVGRGAMGSVYLARDTKLNRHVALKVLLGSLARTPSIVKQFHQEAQSAAPLNHPNIVRIYSAGVEAGTPYIAMEFVDGEPLDRFLKRKGKVNWDVALHVGAQVALALDCAHQHGIVHRDVKPSNILVDRKGSVRLTDFGIARMQSRDGGAGNQVVGTPQYMSPEQLTGGEAWPASDLFALGVTLYQMISGEMPFRGETSMALIKSICEDDPPRLNRLDPAVPDDVARLVAYLIEKDPAGRPASAKVAYGLIHRLQRHRGGTSVVAESLTAFLKEEMEARPFSSLDRKEAQTRKRSSKVRRRLKKGRLSAVLVSNAIVLALLAAAAFAIGPISAARGRERTPEPAPTLNLATVQTIAPGVRHIGVLSDGHTVGDLAWLGDDATLVVRTRGMRGTLADGATGLLSIDAVSGTVTSLAAPARSNDTRSTRQARPFRSWFTTSGEPPASSPVHGSIPVFAPVDDPSLAVLLSQPAGSAAPRSAILYTAPREAVDAPDSQAGAVVAIHPSGDRVCIALYDPDASQFYLIEHSLHGAPSTNERRTTSRADVIPSSVQYAADGQRIVYLRRAVSGDTELWLLRSGGADLDGRRMATGLSGGTLSLDPAGGFVAVTLAATSGTAEVALVDLQTGATTANFGHGTLSAQAWLSDGSGFLFIGPAPDRALMFARAKEPFAPKRANALLGAVGPAYAVSSKTGQVAAADSNGDHPAVFIIEPRALERGPS